MKKTTFFLLITALMTSMGVNAQPLSLEQISPNVYRHISYLDAGKFGKVACNGMVVFDRGEAIIFDTPAEEKDALMLINWIKDSLHCSVKAIVPTHFHADCLGSLGLFHSQGIPSYAYQKTIELAEANHTEVPQHAFRKDQKLKAGSKKVLISFEGEGHTRDNVVAYLPQEKILFGGCLIKELKASKGNLDDANTKAWSETVKAVKRKYSSVETIIPGHGKPGDQALLDYTIQLFEE